MVMPDQTPPGTVPSFAGSVLTNVVLSCAYLGAVWSLSPDDSTRWLLIAAAAPLLLVITSLDHRVRRLEYLVEMDATEPRVQLMVDSIPHIDNRIYQIENRLSEIEASTRQAND